MTSMPPDDPLDGLTDEEMGWHLEHVGYVFVGTGEVARSKVMSSGSVTRVTSRSTRDDPFTWPLHAGTTHPHGASTRRKDHAARCAP
jgi:hypothetical protein